MEVMISMISVLGFDDASVLQLGVNTFQERRSRREGLTNCMMFCVETSSVPNEVIYLSKFWVIFITTSPLIIIYMYLSVIQCDLTKNVLKCPLCGTNIAMVCSWPTSERETDRKKKKRLEYAVQIQFRSELQSCEIPLIYISVFSRCFQPF